MIPINRRDFFGLTVGSAVLSQTNELKAVVPPPIGVRRDIAISDNPQHPDFVAVRRDVEALRKAVAVMKTLPETDFRNWVRQKNIHFDFCPHGNWFFLPWHRAYIYFFEQICRQVSGYPDFMLPFWDWTNHPTIPQVFFEEPFIDNRPGITPLSLARRESVGESAINFVLGTSDFIAFAGGKSNSQRPSTNPFYGTLEYIPHNHIHMGFIRGNMMGNNSPLDPIFWVHHANVDRLWAKWMRMHPQLIPNDGSWRNFPLETFFDSQGNRVNPRVSSLLDNYRLGYRYSDQPNPPVQINPSNIRFYASNDFSVFRQVNKSFQVDENLPLNIINIPKKLSDSVKEIVQTNTSDKLPAPVLRLTIELEKPANPEITVRVFINPPETESEISLDDLSYVATISFFEFSHSHHQLMNMSDESRNFFLDITENIQKLSLASRFTTLEEAKVSIVPVFPDETNLEIKPEIKLKGFKFELIK